MTQTVLLGDVADINSESVGKRYPHSKILYLDTSSVTENSFSELQRFNLSDAPSRAKRIVQDGDIVYSTVRPNLKHFGYIKNPAKNTVASTGFAVVRAKENIDSRYLYYWLAADERTEYLTAIADSQTSTFPAFNPSVLAELRVDLPDLETQKKIADVLGTIDEKIELNRQMNETLEQMGQALFRHYFIDNPEAENWEGGTIADLGEVITGKTPSKARAEYYGNDVMFLKVPDMHGNLVIIKTEDELSRLGADSQPKKYIPQWSTCVSCIATVGIVSLAGEWLQTNQQINSIIPKSKEYAFYNYYLMRSKSEIIKTMASGGSATPNLNKGHFENIKIKLPPVELLQIFQDESEELVRMVHVNTKQIQTLTTLRDTLLPWLISGRLKV